jgi:hypothetical protein
MIIGMGRTGISSVIAQDYLLEPVLNDLNPVRGRRIKKSVAERGDNQPRGEFP